MLSVCVSACVHACVCVCACVRACVCVRYAVVFPHPVTASCNTSPWLLSCVYLYELMSEVIIKKNDKLTMLCLCKALWELSA